MLEVKIPQWSAQETQQLAQGLARVEIDYRRVPERVRVVPMGGDTEGAHGPGQRPPHKTERALPASISAAAYRRRMGWPPV